MKHTQNSITDHKIRSQITKIPSSITHTHSQLLSSQIKIKKKLPNPKKIRSQIKQTTHLISSQNQQIQSIGPIQQQQ